MLLKDSKPYKKRLNASIDHAINNDLKIIVLFLALNAIQVVRYSNVSFANNHNHTTQLGCIIFIVDNHGNFVSFNFKSYKARRIVCSILCGELLEFRDIFDTTFSLADEL